MKMKQVILFILLSLLLMVLSYFFLEMLEGKPSWLYLLPIAILIICDIIFLTNLFIKFAKPPGNKN